MWETSRFRGRNGSGNGNGKGPRGRGNGAVMRMKRVQAEIIANNGWGMPSTLVGARLVLNDLGPQSVTLFASHALELGKPVTLNLEAPRPLTVRGKVTYTALFELSSRIHGKPRYPYRLQIEFDFLNDGEATAVRAYVEELTRTDLKRAG